MFVDDIDVITLGNMVSTYTGKTPMSDLFERKFRTDKDWWYSQREHWTAWCLAQLSNGVGPYVRSTPNMSGRLAYNRVMKPGLMIWVAEAYGCDSEKIKEAIRLCMFCAETEGIGSSSKMCKLIRSVITFDDIIESINKKEMLKNRKQLNKLLR